MEGLVPVTKAGLLLMVEACRSQIEVAARDATSELWDRLVSKEKARCSKKSWRSYPKPRFAFDLESVKEYCNSQDPMFRDEDFDAITKDAKNSNLWLDNLENLAKSELAEEPILLEIKVFDRISRPHLYYWVRANTWFRTL